jgi:hypothetical protein
MEYESRTKRFKWLHDKVNRDINKSTLLHNENEQLTNVMTVLDGIDQKFFREKLNQFVNEQQLSKPYLESDKKNIVISEDEILQLKKILNELKKVEPSKSVNNSENNNEQEDEELLDKLFSEENIVLKDRLNDIIEWLNQKIEHYNSNEIKKFPQFEKLSMAQVQRIRNQDPRSMVELAKNVSEREKDIDDIRWRTNSRVTKSKQIRFVKVLLPILVVLLILVAIAIALVLVL